MKTFKQYFTEADKTCWVCGAKESKRKWAFRNVDGKEYCSKCFKKLPKSKQQEIIAAGKKKDKDLAKKFKELGIDI